MPADTEEHRHHAQFPYAFGIERRDALLQRWLHQFQEREHDAFAGQQFPELGYDLLERARPARVARAMGEEDECLSGHDGIICDAAASR